MSRFFIIILLVSAFFNCSAMGQRPSPARPPSAPPEPTGAGLPAAISVQTAIGSQAEEAFNQAIGRSKEMVSNTFLITKKSLDRLKDADVPEPVLTQLKELKDIEIGGQERFRNELINKIGREQVEKYGEVITRNARQELVITDEFQEKLKSLFLNAKVFPNTITAPMLQKRVERLVLRFTAYAKEENRNRIILKMEKSKERLSAYCGETPCDNNIPPCCLEPLCAPGCAQIILRGNNRRTSDTPAPQQPKN
jgi:hypothetical protein